MYEGKTPCYFLAKWIAMGEEGAEQDFHQFTGPTVRAMLTGMMVMVHELGQQGILEEPELSTIVDNMATCSQFAKANFPIERAPPSAQDDGTGDVSNGQ